jgi:hypothetical protein
MDKKHFQMLDSTSINAFRKTKDRMIKHSGHKTPDYRTRTRNQPRAH